MPANRYKCSPQLGLAQRLSPSPQHWAGSFHPFDLFRKRLHQDLIRPIFQEEANWPLGAWVVGVDASDGIKVRHKENPHNTYAKQTSNQNKSIDDSARTAPFHIRPPCREKFNWTRLASAKSAITAPYGVAV